MREQSARSFGVYLTVPGMALLQAHPGDFFMSEEEKMENRIALVGIIVEDVAAAAEINRILHEYVDWIISRMGVPYRQQGICIISVAIDAPSDVISSLSGKLGMVPGVSVKTLYAKLPASPAKAENQCKSTNHGNGN